MRMLLPAMLLTLTLLSGPVYAADRAQLVWAPFEWYRYQGTADPGKGHPFDSSPNQESNCGCACVAMCVQYATGKWVPMDQAGGEPNVRFAMTGRNRNEGTDWPDVEKALKFWGVPYQWVRKMDGIRNALEQGHPVMAMIQCVKLPRTTDSSARVGRYYEFQWGHLIMIRGVTSDGRYYVCYDPQVFVDKPEHWTETGAPRGKDILYKAADLEAACVVKGGDSFKAVEILKSYSDR